MDSTGGVDRGGMDGKARRASEDLGGKLGDGVCVCVGRWREEGERETARAQSVTVGVAFSLVRWLTQGSGGVVGPAWQWAAGRVCPVPPVACTFCLVGSFGFGPF